MGLILATRAAVTHTAAHVKSTKLEEKSSMTAQVSSSCLQKVEERSAETPTQDEEDQSNFRINSISEKCFPSGFH